MRGAARGPAGRRSGRSAQIRCLACAPSTSGTSRVRGRGCCAGSAASRHRPALVITRPRLARAAAGAGWPSPPVADTAPSSSESPSSSPTSVNDEDDPRSDRRGRPATRCVVCAFGALIREPLLSDYELLNVHPSLLPRWRGAAPIERAIMNGDERRPASRIMRVTAGLDSGPVCLAAEDRRHRPPRTRIGALSARLQPSSRSTLLVEVRDAWPRAPGVHRAGSMGWRHLCGEDHCLPIAC